MKTYIFAVSLACTFLLSKAAPAKERNISPRIFKGTAARPGQFPWQVRLRVKERDNTISICEGSLIAPEWVLTSAYCVHKTKEVELHFGSVTSNGKTVLVSNCYIIHPDYSDPNFDIALIRLPKALNTTSSIRPIALPDADQTVEAGDEVTISGFGQKDGTLNYAKLTTISNAECGRYYNRGNSIHSSKMCAIGKQKENACGGELGGPAVTFDNKNRATLVGVFSFYNSNGCDKGNPSGFTRTAWFRKWIKVYAEV